MHLLRGKILETHRKDNNGQVRVYARQLSPRRALVENSQPNNRRAATRRLHAKARG